MKRIIVIGAMALLVLGCTEDPERINQALKCYNHKLECPRMFTDGYQASIDMDKEEMLRLVKVHTKAQKRKEAAQKRKEAARKAKRQAEREKIEAERLAWENSKEGKAALAADKALKEKILREAEARQQKKATFAERKKRIHDQCVEEELIPGSELVEQLKVLISCKKLADGLKG